RWDDLVRRQPALAEIARERLVAPGVVLVATIRRDGTPRLSPVEPLVLDGDLWLAMLRGSVKAADLARDSRVLVHSIVTSRDGRLGEVKLRGTAVPVDDEQVQRRYAEAVTAELGWQPEVGRFHLFRVELDDVTYLRYDDANGDQYLVRWPQNREVVRRGTSATTLGPPEPAYDVLVPEPPPTSSSTGKSR
ncbi:MAG: pyridoxamine 5'-phosphate oxidase family protein, partial [Actinomycetes bacterium]